MRRKLSKTIITVNILAASLCVILQYGESLVLSQNDVIGVVIIKGSACSAFLSSGNNFITVVIS
jgi:hypothetical protein